MDVYVEKKKVVLDPNNIRGQGGEADVYEIAGGLVLKLFKGPDHPLYQGLPHEQKIARERMEEKQAKLPFFPKDLPERVISPKSLATDRSGRKVLGYTMPFLGDAETLLRYADKTFRQAGVFNDMLIKLFCDLHAGVSEIHKKSTVIGDFNDLNILVRKLKAYFIDADSFQFGSFLTRTFTTKFVDPTLCGLFTPPGKTKPVMMLQKPHNKDSDWYAFAVMLLQSLLFVDPYGGVYRPKEASKRVAHSLRPLHRITIFDDGVRYPKIAVPYKVLPDELLSYFYQILLKDKRGEFPLDLLKGLEWKKCTTCGIEHARGLCPECAQITPQMVKQTVVIKGTVTATRIFRTHGLILFASHQKGKLLWLYHEDGNFRREDKNKVLGGELDPQTRYRLNGSATLVGQGNRLITFKPDGTTENFLVDKRGLLPIFDANAESRYWTQNGKLLRDGQYGPEYIGDVLREQTLFWVGPNFGFGFYMAGRFSVAFVFDAKRRGINDSVILPPVRGQIVDTTCTFSGSRCWFFVSFREKGKTINRCVVINQEGQVEAVSEAEAGDGTWLSSLRGKCAAANFLLVATDEGIVRVEVAGGKIVKTREFPDTESFVDTGSHLFPGKEGLFVVRSKEIQLLKIS